MSKLPPTSAVKVGAALEVLERLAVLPLGPESDHSNVSASPSGSEEALASSVTCVPVVTSVPGDTVKDAVGFWFWGGGSGSSMLLPESQAARVRARTSATMMDEAERTNGEDGEHIQKEGIVI